MTFCDSTCERSVRHQDLLSKAVDISTMPSWAAAATAFLSAPKRCMFSRPPCASCLHLLTRSSVAPSRRQRPLTCLPATYSNYELLKPQQRGERDLLCTAVDHLLIFAGIALVCSCSCLHIDFSSQRSPCLTQRCHWRRGAHVMLRCASPAARAVHSAAVSASQWHGCPQQIAACQHGCCKRSSQGT